MTWVCEDCGAMVHAFDVDEMPEHRLCGNCELKPRSVELDEHD